MVLHDVAKEAFFFKEVAARADADLFGDSDLHMVDVFIIPERFEDGVGKAEDQEILNGFFAEVMVDSIGLGFVEIF